MKEIASPASRIARSLNVTNLLRFRIAQSDAVTGFEVALGELRSGRKVSHWMWYVFPQLRGLGRSPTAQFYSIENAVEARDYLNDPILGGHLVLSVEAVAKQLAEGTALEDLMGGATDSLKVISCVTLFRQIAEEAVESPSTKTAERIYKAADDILRMAGQQGYPPCERTLETLGQGRPGQG